MALYWLTMSKKHSTDLHLGCLRAELRAARGRDGRTNAHIAFALGVPASTLSGWLTGSAPPPRLAQLFDLCHELRTTVAEVATAANQQAVKMAGRKP